MDSRAIDLTDLQRGLLEYRRSLYRPTPRQTVVEWAEANIKLSGRQTESPGPFTTSVRPYTREPLECWKDATVSEVTLCWGSQTAKSTMLMVGACWMICEDPSPMLWMNPTESLVRSFSKTRWRTMLEDCPKAVSEFPRNLHQMTHLEQHFRRCTLNFIGSNSPANIASRPIRVFIADETDKFADATSKEADSLELGEQRLKAFSSSKMFLTSTPTVVEGRIWQRFLRGDQRRFFIPCPHCKTPIKLLWGQVKWDEAARLPDKAWDMGRVRASAHYLCQACSQPISDAQKFVALRSGEWRAENAGAMPGVRSYHLSSLYAPDRKCTWGHLAVQFLEAKASLLGLQSFINGVLAEPWESHESTRERMELITSKMQSDEKWKKALTVDCQARAPYFWYVVRAWTSGHSEAVEAGPLDTWEEIEAVQKSHHIPDVGVFIDSGWGARSDADVYGACMRRCEVVARPSEDFELLPAAIGWQPCKGFPGRKRWKSEDTGLWLPYYLRAMDPFLGTAHAGQVEMSLFEFAGDFFKDILDMMRTRRSPHEWSVPGSVATETYWRHLDGEIRDTRRNPKTGRTTYAWKKRSTAWPNHLFDCEVMQIAAASFFGLLDVAGPTDGEEDA